MRTHILKTVAFGSMALTVLVLVVATLLEKIYGTSFTLSNIYHSTWFIALWSLLAVTAMAYTLSISRRTTLIIFHMSLAVILSGAFLSFVTSKHGNIILARETVPASMFTTDKGTLEKLPFTLQLAGIDTIYTNDGKQLCDYRATVILDDKEEICLMQASLNKPIKREGYSFCIKGTDDGNLSLLVAHDIYGLPVSYAGYLMMFLSFIYLFIDKQSGFSRIICQLKGDATAENPKDKPHHKAFGHKVIWLLPIAPIVLFVVWKKDGTFPVTNGVESLLFLAMTATALAIVFRFKKRFAHLSGVLAIAAGITALIAICSFDGNNSVQPILRSPLLGIHVTTIIVAYALLGCTAINATVALFCKSEKRAKSLALIGQLMLYPATMLLATGIFIGAVWANVSWGRYWGWDPKEVWALITLLACSFTFHTHSLPFMAKPPFFHKYCILLFLTMLFTYLGVSYLLGGMHSYM